MLHNIIYIIALVIKVKSKQYSFASFDRQKCYLYTQNDLNSFKNYNNKKY